MPLFSYPITISGPYGQYTIDAVVDPSASFTIVPTLALIEMGIEPVRVVQMCAPDGSTYFQRLGRALTTVAGQEDVSPVVFGETGKPTVLGKLTLDLLLLDVDEANQTLVQRAASEGTSSGEGAVKP